MDKTLRRIFAFIYAIFLLAMIIFVTGNSGGSTSEPGMDIETAFAISIFLAWFVAQLSVFINWIFGDRTTLWQIYYLITVVGFCIMVFVTGGAPWNHFLKVFLFGVAPVVVVAELIYHHYFDPNPDAR